MSSFSPDNWLNIKRTVRFGEADAAGVIHFSHLLRWCHEAWEESLDHYGLASLDIFPSGRKGLDKLRKILPIVHCEADFFQPIVIGDSIDIKLLPKRNSPSSFQVQYDFEFSKQKVAKGLIVHLAIDSSTKKRCNLPESIERWIEASTLDLGEKSIDNS